VDGAGDWMKNYDTVVIPMLEDGLRVMIYAGVQDLICNWSALSRTHQRKAMALHLVFPLAAHR